MAKQNSKILNFVVWLTGVLVSLAVGFGMVDKVLTIRWLEWNGAIITVVAGWVVIVLTILSVILAIVDRL